MKKTIIVLVVLILGGIGLYYWLYQPKHPAEGTPNGSETTTTAPQGTETATSTPTQGQEVIGKSIQGRDIVAFHFGTGDKELLFVGGIHGGYEWNTVLLAYQLVDYLTQNPSVIPAGERVTVVPTLNPDGLHKVTGKDGRFSAADVSSSQSVQVSGRFNADSVDLNRNFDCDWQKTGTWQNTTVSGGSAAFSEPESAAMRDYIAAHTPTAVVVYYSAAGGVFASSCHAGVLPETSTLTDLYASASGYQPYETFDFYQVTGDMVNWLAKEKIPAVSVLLTNHQSTEWAKNQLGIDAILQHYAK